jgi:hypothetical protein
MGLERIQKAGTGHMGRFMYNSQDPIMIDNTTAEVMNRVMSLKEFEVKRMLDEPLMFTGGSIPFDIRANQECAWFKVLAVSQQEAENKVDTWLNREDLND